ncbi:MAG: hypothetical protein R2748_01715 [Bryobacterales bacterium]
MSRTLASGEPGVTAEPRVPPLRIASRESTRSSPSAIVSALWQP